MRSKWVCSMVCKDIQCFFVLLCCPVLVFIRELDVVDGLEGVFVIYWHRGKAI